VKILTIVGARPQFVKAAALSRIIKYKYTDRIEEVMVHTGQHFDNNMSKIFFDELEIPPPKYNLEISNLIHGAMTGRMIEEIEKVIIKERPDWVVVFGDTNSTLAAALAATKHQILLAHIEAGLRSFNMTMPEEVNRVITDRVSNILFCPTTIAVKNLEREGYPFVMANGEKQKINFVGDIMYDATLYFRSASPSKFSVEQLGLIKQHYILCTIHRAENADNVFNLRNILLALQEINKKIQVVLPLHPRTRKMIQENTMLNFLKDLKVLEPLSYLQMQRLEMDAKLIITDSGGVQKEAYFHSVPCLTIRKETEWIETIKSGWNFLSGTSPDEIIAGFTRQLLAKKKPIADYGDGFAATKILESIMSF
jgi:UDP-GlcNAc3NAcA epimerase